MGARSVTVTVADRRRVTDSESAESQAARTLSSTRES